MSTLYLGLAGFLLLMILAGLIRILRGPTAAERMQAAMLLGTSGVAIPCCSSRRHSQRARCVICGAVVFAARSFY